MPPILPQKKFLKYPVNIMKKLFYILLPFICLAVCGPYCDSEAAIKERIINFHSDIVIEETGTISVTESIKVFARGDEIKRGIVRSLPVYRTNKYGKKENVKIDIISVLRNGVEEKYKSENTGGYKEIYIGDPNVYLSPGVHEYVIVYESPGQIGFFDTYDELYWNVTGNGWVFAIETASASITLPNDAHRIDTSCYTGPFGSTEMHCASNDADNKVNFATQNKLFAHEGFTVAVSFPRDIIKRPPPPTQLELFYEEYKYSVSALLCLSIFIVFFYFTWRKVGKDPERPVAIPTFNPPHGRSPADTRYLYKRKDDNKLFTAALVGMAVKRAIRIANKNKQYTLEPLEKKENLSVEEKEIYDTLFKNNKSVTVTNTNYSKFATASNKLTEALQKSWKLEDYFLNNTKYIKYMTALIPLLLIFYLMIIGKIALRETIILTAPFMGLAVVSMFTKKISKGCLAAALILFGLIIFGMVSCFMSVVALVMTILLLEASWAPGVLILALLVLYAAYIYLIKAPTKLGAQTSSELEGFKMYLKTAEENRLNLLTPPEKTPELFEKLLPYAIALDVENEWGKKFTKILKQANYVPDWYNGDKSFTASRFPSTFARSFTSSVGRAQTNPERSSSSSSGGSWSSGSSGSGSSGGGGGGGGGRGW